MPAIDTTKAPGGALQTHEYVSLWWRARPYMGWGGIACLAAVLLFVSLAWAPVDANKSFVSPARATTDANVSFEPYYSYFGGHGLAFE